MVVVDEVSFTRENKVLVRGERQIKQFKDLKEV